MVRKPGDQREKVCGVAGKGSKPNARLLAAKNAAIRAARPDPSTSQSTLAQDDKFNIYRVTIYVVVVVHAIP